MLTDSEIKEILNGSIENRNVDIKSGFTWNTKSHTTLEIIKDIMAMSNTQDGGKLIIGVNQKKNIFEGNETDWFESFDQTKIMLSVKKYVSSAINLQVIKKPNFEWNNEKGNIVIIDVADFEYEPIIAKDGTDSEQNSIFYAGDVFIRTEKASTEKIKDAQIMKELIHRATLKDRQGVLNDIKSLLEYKPIQDVNANPMEQYLEDISNFENTFHKSEFIPTFDKGVWNLETMPVKKNSELIQFQELWKIVTTSQSRHRGWPFPIIGEDITKARNNYLETLVPLDSTARNNECWRLHKNGLFCWTKSMFENENNEYQNTLSKVNAIWTITEMFLFASRIYEKVLSKSEKVHIRFTISGSNGRRYHDEIMSEYKNPIELGGRCNSDIIVIERTISVLNLQMGLKDSVNNVVEELDAHFGVRQYDQNYTIRLMDQILDMHMIRPEY